MANQKKTQSNHTLFPKQLFIVPFSELVGANRSIFSYSDLDENNAIKLNNASEVTEGISINSDGVQFDLERTAEEIQILDRFGVGTADERETQRDGTITINVNGYGTDIQNLINGLNPKKDVKQDFKFAKDGRPDSIKSFEGLDGATIQESGANFTGTIIFEDGIGIPTPINPLDNFVGAILHVDVRDGFIIDRKVIKSGSGYPDSPSVNLTNATKFIDDDGIEQTDGVFDVATAGDGTTFVTTMGSYNSATASIKNAHLVKEKFTIICEIDTGDDVEGSIFLMAPYTTPQSDTFSVNLTGSKQDFAINFRTLKLIDNNALNILKDFAEPITGGSGMIFYWNSSNVKVTD